MVNAVAFTANQIQTFTATGVGSVPAGAIAVLVGGNCTSATAGAYAQFAPHGGTLGDYFAFGNVPVANGFCNGFGIAPIDSTGKLDIKLNAQAGSVDLWMFGYIV